MATMAATMAQCSDIVIIGGGAIGLAIAVELRLADVKVTVLNCNRQQGATLAAAGMLAPQAEGLLPGPMLDLCLQSRHLYPAWIDKLEHLTNLTADYWSSGILQPLYRPPSLVPPQNEVQGWLEKRWLDRADIQRQQPGLSPDVIGGWWFPQDGQVDNRQLAKVLLAAAQRLGVEVREGLTVQKLTIAHETVTAVQTIDGLWQADRYILATGAWAADLLPVAVFPRKGQMLSVSARPTDPQLNKVLFGEEVYIVPRRDGRILIGATVETVGFQAGNTPWGIDRLLQAAMRLYPAIAQMPILEFWWGFRPATPDECPLLGPSPYPNLILATGHYRNGILLTPITAQLITNFVVRGTCEPILHDFHYDRFLHQ